MQNLHHRAPYPQYPQTPRNDDGRDHPADPDGGQHQPQSCVCTHTIRPAQGADGTGGVGVMTDWNSRESGQTITQVDVDNMIHRAWRTMQHQFDDQYAAMLLSFISVNVTSAWRWLLRTSAYSSLCRSRSQKDLPGSIHFGALRKNRPHTHGSRRSEWQ